MEKWKLYLKIIINFFIFLLLLLFAIFVLPKLVRFFLPVIIGWIVSMIANPFIRFLEQRMKIVRKLSSAVLIIVIIVAVVGGLYGIATLIVKEAIELSRDMPIILDKIYESTHAIQDKIQGIIAIFPDFLLNLNQGNNLEGDYLSNSLKPYVTLDNASSFAKNIADAAFFFIITVLFAYFFIAERDSIVQSLKKIIPPSIMEYCNYILNGFKVAVGGYFKAQLKLMFIMMLILFIGLEILQVNYSFLLALGIAILDILPFFGTGFVLWPWALADLLLGNYFRAIGIVIIYVLCQVIKQVLQPKMVGDSVGMSPMLTLLFMYIGYKIMGVIGIIIGVPIGIILFNLYHMGLFERFLRGLKIIVTDINEFRKY